VVCGARRLTYRELDVRSSRLAHGLAAHGVDVGQHVGLLMHDSVEHVETMLACYKRRAVPINVNWRYTHDELAYLFADADLVALVCEPSLRPARTPPITIETGPQFEATISSGAAERAFGPRSGDDRYVLYTGGTTGSPKGVVWRQEDIIFAVLGGGNSGGPPVTRPEDVDHTVMAHRAQRLRAFLPPGDPGPEQFVQLALGPLMHASGQWSALTTLLGGGKVVLNPDHHVDMARILTLIGQEGVVSLNLVGDVSALPLLAELAAHPGRYDTSSLRLMGSGGTMLTGWVKSALLDAIPTVLAISEAVGSSEAPVEAASVATREAGAPESLRFAARADTAVLDDDLRPVTPGSGAIGRVATRGRIPIGYHNDPEKTARTFVTVDGTRWSLPGDMATVDSDGSIRLLGRGSMCINTGGEKVYPEEVEAVLKTHTAVADALVVGRPHPRLGEQVAVLVQPREDPPTLEQLQEHCRPRLAGYKIPRHLVVVDRLTRSPSGKPDYAWARRVIERDVTRSG
jgi:3-oxocholest-4-en-26-oate---CoA ligase